MTDVDPFSVLRLPRAAVQIDNALAEAYRSGDALTKDNITLLRRDIAFEIGRLELMYQR